MEKKNWFQAIVALVLVVAAGAMLLLAISHFKSYDRTVAVRGLCVREVKADRAIYPIVFNEVGNDLSAVAASAQTKSQRVVKFLKDNGFEDSEISVSSPKVSDNQANSYSSNAINRYSIKVTVTVFTKKVDEVLALAEKQTELINEGIAISGESWESPVEYIFEGLNDIKPAMIEEANKNAYKSAEQFAKDSHSRVGKIKDAVQGLFSIEDRDSYTPYIKEVRVVTSVTYYLR